MPIEVHVGLRGVIAANIQPLRAAHGQITQQRDIRQCPVLAVRAGIEQCTVTVRTGTGHVNVLAPQAQSVGGAPPEVQRAAVLHHRGRSGRTECGVVQDTCRTAAYERCTRIGVAAVREGERAIAGLD